MAIIKKIDKSEFTEMCIYDQYNSLSIGAIELIYDYINDIGYDVELDPTMLRTAFTEATFSDTEDWLMEEILMCDIDYPMMSYEDKLSVVVSCLEGKVNYIGLVKSIDNETHNFVYGS